MSDYRPTFAALNRLPRGEQVRRVACTYCGAPVFVACRLSRDVCTARWQALMNLRADLVFEHLGGVHHTGVPCGRCGAQTGERCRNTTLPAHYGRVQFSARAAGRLVNDLTGAARV